MKNLKYSDDDIAKNKMIDNEIIIITKVIQIIVHVRGMLRMMIALSIYLFCYVEDMCCSPPMV